MPPLPLVPLVLVHGAGGVGRLWQNQLLAFPRALAPDLPGHPEGPGLSTIPDMAGWVRRFMEERGLNACVLGGHSMGSAVALQVALDAPGRLRGLILMGAGARLRVRQEVFDLIRADYEAAVEELLRWWFAPGTPLEIRREGDRVILRHEWMDVERIVHLDLDEHPTGIPRTSLGHSIGRFEGDTLVIETASYAEGVLNQYVEVPGRPTRGLLHSDALTSVERVSFDRDRQRLVVTIELDDAAFFTRSFDPATAEYAPTNLEIQTFNCRPENPDHTLRKQ